MEDGRELLLPSLAAGRESWDLTRNHFDNQGPARSTRFVLLQACQSMGIHCRYVDLPATSSFAALV